MSYIHLQQLIKYKSSRINIIMWKQVGTEDTKNIFFFFLQFDMHIFQEYQNINLNYNCFECKMNEILYPI